MNTIRSFLVGGLLILLAAPRVVAHHAFGAEFDRDAPIRLQGKIVKLEWVNPHSWIHLEVAAGDVFVIETPGGGGYGPPVET